MGEVEAEKQRSSVLKKIKLAVMILILVCAAVYVPAKFFAVKLTNRGTQLFNEGKLDEAIAKYERAMKIFPGFKPAREMLGKTCNEKAERAFNGNEYAEAEALYKRAIKLGVEATDVHYRLAYIYWALGKNAEGLAELEEHSKQRPNDSRAVSLRNLLQGGKGRKPKLKTSRGSTPRDGVGRRTVGGRTGARAWIARAASQRSQAL